MSTLRANLKLPGGQEIEVCQGDITLENVDAIVNAANANLQHGGGVAAAIVHKGGKEIQEESDEWVRRFGPVTHDKPAVTSGGKLLCQYIIHAVGPLWGSGDEDNKLADAVYSSLELADRLLIESIAFPAISTGIFGFPKDQAAVIIFATIQDYFTLHPNSSIKLVRLTIIDQETLTAFLTELNS